MARKGTQKTTGTAVSRGPAGKGTATATLSHEQIAERARVIWEKRGRPYGEDEKIWLEAEEQLARELGVR